MSEFMVRAGALETAGDRFRSLADQTPGALAYAGDHLSLNLIDTGTLLATVLLTTGAAQQDVVAALNTVNDHLSAAASELLASATLYRETDDAVDRALDAGYGAGS